MAYARNTLGVQRTRSAIIFCVHVTTRSQTLYQLIMSNSRAGLRKAAIGLVQSALPSRIQLLSGKLNRGEIAEYRLPTIHTVFLNSHAESRVI